MIENLHINNFKSIQELSMTCKRVNVLIGEPNSGKSNIIEALSLQSQNAINGNGLNPDIFRYKSLGDLFYDFKINTPIRVTSNQLNTELFYNLNPKLSSTNQFIYYLNKVSENDPHSSFSHDGKLINAVNHGDTDVKFYEFKKLKSFQQGYYNHLSPPFGENLPSLLLAYDELKSWVSDFFKEKDFILTLKPLENDINLSKMVNQELYSYPYSAISETLQRIVFYQIAIKSNKSSVLLFDEPESNTFPFYTKYIAERIALDENNNQFFVTTHNPYLLLSLIEKTPLDELNVCLVQMKDYKTVLHELNKEQISQVLDFNSDVFFNFDSIIAE